MTREIPDRIVGPWCIGIGLVGALGFLGLSFVVTSDRGLMLIGMVVFLLVLGYGLLLVIFEWAERRQGAPGPTAPRDS